MQLYNLVKGILLFALLRFLSPIVSHAHGKGDFSSIGSNEIEAPFGGGFPYAIQMANQDNVGLYIGIDDGVVLEMEKKEHIRKEQLEAFISDHLSTLSPFYGSGNGGGLQKAARFLSMNAALPTQAEYDALMDFYQATDGANWVQNSGWSTANPNVAESLANWDNIIVDANGHVIHIHLNFNNLKSVLPSTLQNLNYLKWFRISGNNLTEQLPNFTNMPDLTLVEFSRNNFTGVLPASCGINVKLEEIHAHMNNIGGSIPSSYSNLANLKVFYAEDNQLSWTIPDSFGGLAELTELQLCNNSIKGSLPAVQGNLTKLEEFRLQNKQWSILLKQIILNMWLDRIINLFHCMKWKMKLSNCSFN